MPKAKATRKTLKANPEGFLRHLRVINTHGLFEQGSEAAIAIGKEVLYWQKGLERIPLTDQEVAQEISKL